MVRAESAAKLTHVGERLGSLVVQVERTLE